MKNKPFWELKLNSHTMTRDYPYSYIEKNERMKKASKLKTIKRKLKKLQDEKRKKISQAKN